MRAQPSPMPPLPVDLVEPMETGIEEPNPQPALSSVGYSRYDCFHYSTCLGTAAQQGWTGLSCEACPAYQQVPSETIQFEACAQVLGAVLQTAQHDLEHGVDDSFWEAAAFVFHQPDFGVLCGLLNIDPDAARQAQWDRLASAQRDAIIERWPQSAQPFA